MTRTRTLGLAALLVALAGLAPEASAGGFGLGFLKIHRYPDGYVLPPGPGDGYGFPNGNPDGYGYTDYGVYLPQHGDRSPSYHFPRYYAVPPEQMFFPTYYNPYMNRGQRFIPYLGCGGDHPAGGPPSIPSETPVYPYQDTIGNAPRTNIPNFTGRVEARPVNPGSSGLRP